MNEKLKTRILDFFFPQHLKCHACSREASVNDHGLCDECEEKLLFSAEPPSIEHIDGFVSALQYNDCAKSLVTSFKFNGAVYKKEALTHYIKLPERWDYDFIVPVPLHKKRYKKRGYNQSAILGEVIAKRYNKPMREDLLIRSRHTQAQSGLTGEARKTNVVGAFKASEECRGLKIQLVDDVKTTGATLKACALELKNKGAVAVYAVTACCSMEEKHEDV